MMSKVVINELTSFLRDNLLSFFESVAFADNPDDPDDLSIDERTYLFSRESPGQCEG